MVLLVARGDDEVFEPTLQVPSGQLLSDVSRCEVAGLKSIPSLLFLCLLCRKVGIQQGRQLFISEPIVSESWFLDG